MTRMPVHLAESYVPLVRSVSKRVRAEVAPDFDYDLVELLAWEVTAERWTTWERGEYKAWTDLYDHLRDAVKAERRAQGWRQKVVAGGKRDWVKPPAEIATGLRRFGATDDDPALADWSRGPEALLDLDDTDVALRMAGEWFALTEREAYRFARILRARYPRLCDEAEAVYYAPRKPRQTVAQWEQSREDKRRALARRYAFELTEVWRDAINPVNRRRAA